MKVSVLMITYNQEQYLAQALDSVLMQRVDFDYEIVIGEDRSTDGTRDIVLEYRQRYPDRIRVLLHDENIGMLPNFADTFHACQGEYVAILEGDDFWTSPDKLQKQAAFLDQHPETALCFHTTKVFYQHDDAPSFLSPSDHKEFSTIENLLEDNFIQTCSVMFRNKLFGKLPDWFCTGTIGDYPLHLLNAAHGNIGYIKEVMGAYRVHSAGVWSMQMDCNYVKNALSAIKMYDNLDMQFDGKYHRIIERKTYQQELGLYKWYLRKGSYGCCLKQAVRLLCKYPRLLFLEKVRYELRKNDSRLARQIP